MNPIQALLFLLLLLLSGCGTSQLSDSGGSSIEVVGFGGWVRGKAVTTDSLPVNNGIAKLVHVRNLSTSSMEKTAQNGDFSLDITETGQFGLVIYDSLNNGYFSPLHLQSREEQIDLETVVLKPMGAIEGKINCEELIQWEQSQYYPEDFLITIPEVGRIQAPDTAGTFRFPNLPAGEYTIQVSPRTLAINEYNSPALYDTTVTLGAGETVNLPEIVLKSTPFYIDDSLFVEDSGVVRRILDANGISSGIMKHSGIRRNRIVQLKLRNIDTLPESIGELEKLEWLSIQRGTISELPGNIAQCLNLQRIDISNTHLDTLPMELALCENLTMIDLSYNRFTSIPEVLMEMPFTPVINLEYNRIYPSEHEQKWLLTYRFMNDTLQLHDWEETQSDSITTLQ